jgi:hypothetical protein
LGPASRFDAGNDGVEQRDVVEGIAGKFKLCKQRLKRACWRVDDLVVQFINLLVQRLGLVIERLRPRCLQSILNSR